MSKAFQRQKEHLKEKEVFRGELEHVGVIMRAFQMVKVSLRIKEPSIEVAEMCLMERAFIKEAGDGEISHSTMK